MRRLLSLVAIAIAACGGDQPAPKPAKYGGSILHGGLHSVSVDGTTITGTGSAGDPLVGHSGLSGGINGRMAVWSGASSLTTYGGSSPCTSGQAMTSLQSNGGANCSTFYNSTGTGLTSTGSSVSVSLTPTSCSAGNHVSAISSAGVGTCTADSGGVTGSGTTGDLMKWSGSTAAGNYAGSTATACTAGAVVTDAAFSAAGALSLTCGVTPITGSLTSGTIPVASGTSALTNSGLTDNGTAFSSSRDLNEFGSTAGAYYVSAFGWACKYNTSANAVCHINQHGTADGTTFNRDLSIDDGKGNAVAYFTGSTKAVEFMGAATVDGNTTLGNASTDTTIVEGHLHGAATTPTVTACGGAGSVAGSDIGGIITTSGAATSCTLNFGATWSNTPACVFEMASNTSTAAIYITAQSTSAVTFTFPNSLGTAQIVNYVCVGR